MKFYLHYEADPEYTMAFKWEEGRRETFGDIVTLFSTSYNRRFPDHLLKAENLKLKDAAGKEVEFEKDVRECVKQTGMDFFVSRKPAAVQSTEELIKSAEKEADFLLKGSRVNELVALQLAHESVAEKNPKAAAVVFQYILKSNPHCVQALVELSKIMHAAKRFSEAVKYLKQATDLDTSNCDMMLQLADYYLDAGNPKKALEMYNLYLKKADALKQEKIDLIKVSMARCMRVDGEDQAAMYILGDVLRKNKEHVDALLEYARIAGQREGESLKEAFSICAALLPERQKDAAYHRFFTTLVQKKGGLDLLYQELQEAGQSCAALGYLAMLVREHGAVREAAKMLKKALGYQPDALNTFLAYIHTLQMCRQWDRAYVAVRDLVVKFPDLTADGLKLEWFKPLLPDVSSIYLTKCLPNEGKMPSELVDYKPNPEREFISEELDLVAILFTLVKIAFFSGAIPFIDLFCTAMDPLHCNRNLHKTQIRNEAAYFSCIQKVKEVPGICEKPADVSRFIYFAGESHSVPASWRQIEYKSRCHVLHPVLATGVKIWHLRPECSFYPKMSFYNAIKRIPDGANVIFCFGEIDCREGLMSALRKNVYDTLKQAMSVLVDIYMAVLKELHQKRKFKIFVHPVAPVLDETRETVVSFNKVLKHQLSESKIISFLDFGDDLLTEDEKKLKKEYEFDSTHLHPKYLSLLEKALNSV